MAVLASDNFSGSGATIQAANPDWLLLSGPSMPITPEGRARLALSPGGTSVYAYDVESVPSPDYEVSQDIYVMSANNDAVGPSGRIQSASVFYHARYNGRSVSWELYQFGPTTLLGSWAEVIPVGATRRVTLRMVGSSISLLVNGVTRIAVTNTAIALPGLPGVRGITEGASNSAGLHSDNWLAETIDSGIKIPVAMHHRKQQGIG